MRDPLSSNSVLVWSGSQASGQVSINEPGARATDAATEQTQGAYRKLSPLYLQALTPNWTVYGSLLAQRAGKNLDSSEKFACGGAQGVRAYPVGEAAGEEGMLGTVELRYALPQVFGATPSLIGFVDAGRVQTNKNQFAARLNARTLSAAGVGVTLTKTNDYD